MARKATAQDVADLAGVSRSAVSLVLNGRAAGNISPAKQRAVRAAAEQLRYTPNAVALSLRSRRSRTIGVLTWPGWSGFSQVLLHRAQQSAGAYGYLLLVMDTDDDREVERRQLETLRDRQVDGFLVVAPELVHYQPCEVLASSYTVLVNCLDPDGSVTCVAPDEVEAGRTAARTLLEAGHRRIGLVVGDLEALQTRLRVDGVQRALVAAGLPPSTPVPGGRDVDTGFYAVHALLTGPDRPTALICSHERLAVGALLAATQVGLTVPTGLSVVSLEDGEHLTSRFVPPLTTVHRPDRAMAEQAVTLLVEALASDLARGVRRLMFDCPLRERSSVGPPRVTGST